MMEWDEIDFETKLWRILLKNENGTTLISFHCPDRRFELIEGYDLLQAISNTFSIIIV